MDVYIICFTISYRRFPLALFMFVNKLKIFAKVRSKTCDKHTGPVMEDCDISILHVVVSCKRLSQIVTKI